MYFSETGFDDMGGIKLAPDGDYFLAIAISQLP
jgi:hypothetical protein